MKRIILFFVLSSLLLSALAFSSIAADSYVDLFTTPQNDTASKYKQKFWDVGKEHWAFEYIAELSLCGVINGYADGSFKPENTVTRAEWAKIMILVAGITPNDNSVRFSDMKGHWANTYVNAASKYLTAFSDNSYRPNQAVTREDVTMALVKLKGYSLDEVDYSVLTRFKDTASISNSMKVYVAIAVEKGLINGFEDSTFRGQATLTRAEASTLLWRAFQFGNDNKIEASESGTTTPVAPPSTDENNYNTPDDETTDSSENQNTPSTDYEHEEELNPGTPSAEDETIYNKNKSSMERLAKEMAETSAMGTVGNSYSYTVNSMKVLKSDNYFRYVISMSITNISVSGTDQLYFEVLIRTATDMENHEVYKISTKITEDDMKAAGWGTRPENFGAEPEE